VCGIYGVAMQGSIGGYCQTRNFKGHNTAWILSQVVSFAPKFPTSLANTFLQIEDSHFIIAMHYFGFLQWPSRMNDTELDCQPLEHAGMEKLVCVGSFAARSSSNTPFPPSMSDTNYYSIQMRKSSG
jgi:hypothetical protein